MILLIFTLFLCFVLCAGLIYIYTLINPFFKEKEYLKDNIIFIKKELNNIKADIQTLQNNPAEFTKRFTMVDFKIKNLENVIQTFNHGFTPNQSYM